MTQLETKMIRTKANHNMKKRNSISKKMNLKFKLKATNMRKCKKKIKRKIRDLNTRHF